MKKDAVYLTNSWLQCMSLWIMHGQLQTKMSEFGLAHDRKAAFLLLWRRYEASQRECNIKERRIKGCDT